MTRAATTWTDGADIGVLQHRAGRHGAPAGFETQAAEASPVNSDAPMNAVRAIQEQRSVVMVVGIVPARNNPMVRFR
jgi:hypothetical protein